MSGLILDEALTPVRLAWRALAIPLLTTLPWWLMVAEGLRLVAGPDHAQAPARAYFQWSALTVGVIAIAAWGRANWACHVARALDGQVEPTPQLKMPLGDVIVAMLLHMLLLLLTALGSWLVIPALLLPWSLSLAAAGAATRPGATSWKACCALVGDAVPFRPWLGAWFCCGCVAILIGGNLWLGGYGLASLLADLLGMPAHVWSEYLAPWSVHPWILFLVLSWALTDPVLVAAAVVHQRRVQARSTGSDLVATLHRLETQS
jgi:hypothetical protein